MVLEKFTDGFWVYWKLLQTPMEKEPFIGMVIIYSLHNIELFSAWNSSAILVLYPSGQ